MMFLVYEQDVYLRISFVQLRFSFLKMKTFSLYSYSMQFQQWKKPSCLYLISKLIHTSDYAVFSFGSSLSLPTHDSSTFRNWFDQQVSELISEFLSKTRFSCNFQELTLSSTFSFQQSLKKCCDFEEAEFSSGEQYFVFFRCP